MKTADNVPSVGKKKQTSPRQTRHLAGAELEQFSAAITAHFSPPPDQDTQVHLIEVDPFRVHVSWQVAEKDLSQLRLKNPQTEQSAPLTLRLHNVAYMDFSGANPHASTEIRLDVLQGSRYLTVGGGKTLLAEIGLGGTFRQFTLLARSETVHMPRLVPALQQSRVMKDRSALGQKEFTSPLWTLPQAAPGGKPLAAPPAALAAQAAQLADVPGASELRNPPMLPFGLCPCFPLALTNCAIDADFSEACLYLPEKTIGLPGALIFSVWPISSFARV